MVCEGNEVGLLNCSTGPFGIHNCDHSEEVSVTRNPASKFMGAQSQGGGFILTISFFVSVLQSQQKLGEWLGP